MDRSNGHGRNPAIAEEPEPLPVEEMDIPADVDDDDGSGLDELLRAGPTLLDEMAGMLPAGRANEAAPERSTYRQPRPGAYRPALSNRNRGIQPLYGPGSKTRAVGVNDMAIGANQTGDGFGNVLRDNMKHFGIVGTRAR